MRKIAGKDDNIKKGILIVLVVCGFLVPGALLADECMEGDCDNGIGTGFTEEGKIYEGEWKDGYPHGRGTLYIAGGKMITGEWVKGKLVREKKEEQEK